MPDCRVTIEASQYPAMPYVSPCASSHAASGAVAGLMGGRVAAVASGSSAMSPVAATAAKARDIPVIRAGTRARAASTAPHGSTAATSREPWGDGITETRYVPTLKTIAATSSCSARLALRQVHITRARPNMAASRQISPKAAPAPPSLVPGPATDPKRMRTSSHVTDACWGHSLGEESRALGGTITNAAEMHHRRPEHRLQRHGHGRGDHERRVAGAELPPGQHAIAADQDDGRHRDIADGEVAELAGAQDQADQRRREPPVRHTVDEQEGHQQEQRGPDVVGFL